ncbi:MAG: hypothetical protein U1A73_10235 [Pseudomonas sp.]|nr:hypothetical protein [Pseudomonas sp.]
MKGIQYLVAALWLAAGATMAQEVTLLPTGLQDSVSGTPDIQEHAGSVTVTVRPSIDTRNRGSCRRAVTTHEVDGGIRCFFTNSGAIDPGCRINLATQLGNDTGGHQHSSNRPLGTVTPTTGLGSYQFTYTAPEVSGQVNIVATGVSSSGQPISPFTFHVNVETPGLVELRPSSLYRFIGAAGSHVQRFWGTPELVQSMIGLASDYHAAYPDHTLGINDMNLPKGGLFDFKGDWSEPHCGHRSNNADLRTNDIPMARRARLTQLIADNGMNLFDETGTISPHYHVSR